MDDTRDNKGNRGGRDRGPGGGGRDRNGGGRGRDSRGGGGRDRDGGRRDGPAGQGRNDDRPRRNFRDGEGQGSRGPRREGDDRPPRRDRDDRGGDRPRRNFRDGEDRPPRRDGDDRPRRNFRDGEDRPPRRDGDDRPRRNFRDDSNRGPRGPRREGDDRPPRRDRDDRGERGAGGEDRPRGPRRDGGGRDNRGPRRDDRRDDPREGPRGDRREGRGHFRKTEGRETGRREGKRPGGPRRPVEVAVRSDRRGGNQDSPHWIFGRHAVLAALNNPKRDIQRLVATEQMAEQAGVLEHSLLEKLTRPDMDHMLSRYDAAAATHGGIAAYAAPLPAPSVETLLKPEGPAVCVLLDQVSDPHNAGAIMRSAAAFGARAVIAPERNSAPITGSMAKSASGALETVPYLKPTNLARTLAMLKEWGYWRIGLDGTSDKPLEEAAGFERVALVLGSEGKGLRRLTAENCDLLVSIPMSSSVESLNVSNAAAIAMYSLFRRQTQ